MILGLEKLSVTARASGRIGALLVLLSVVNDSVVSKGLDRVK